jgi:hypothetical protein
MREDNDASDKTLMKALRKLKLSTEVCDALINITHELRCAYAEHIERLETDLKSVRACIAELTEERDRYRGALELIAERDRLYEENGIAFGKHAINRMQLTARTALTPSVCK